MSSWWPGAEAGSGCVSHKVTGLGKVHRQERGLLMMERAEPSVVLKVERRGGAGRGLSLRAHYFGNDRAIDAF